MTSHLMAGPGLDSEMYDPAFVPRKEQVTARFTCVSTCTPAAVTSSRRAQCTLCTADTSALDVTKERSDQSRQVQRVRGRYIYDYLW